MIVNLTPLELLTGLGVLVAVAWFWRASVRRARRVATAAREGARLASLTGRVLLASGLFAVTQWVLIARRGNPLLIAVFLGIPDLLAGFVLARALTVTTVDGAHRRRGGDQR